MNAGQHERGILASPHQCKTFRNLRLGIPPHRSTPGCRGLNEFSDVADGERHAIGLEDHCLSNVVGLFQITDAAHSQFLIAVVQESATHV